MRWLLAIATLSAVALGTVGVAYKFGPAIDRTPSDDQTIGASGSQITPIPPSGIGSQRPSIPSAIIIPGCRLTIFEKQEVPSPALPNGGQLLVVGTPLKPGEKPHYDEDGTPLDVLIEVKVLAAEVLPGETIPPGTELTAEGLPAGKRYRRVQEGEEVSPARLIIGKEQRWFRPLHEGDDVVKGQLVAVVDPTLAMA